MNLNLNIDQTWWSFGLETGSVSNSGQAFIALSCAYLGSSTSHFVKSLTWCHASLH